MIIPEQYTTIGVNGNEIVMIQATNRYVRGYMLKRDEREFFCLELPPNLSLYAARFCLWDFAEQREIHIEADDLMNTRNGIFKNRVDMVVSMLEHEEELYIKAVNDHG